MCFKGIISGKILQVQFHYEFIVEWGPIMGRKTLKILVDNRENEYNIFGGNFGVRYSL